MSPATLGGFSLWPGTWPCASEEPSSLLHLLGEPPPWASLSCVLPGALPTADAPAHSGGQGPLGTGLEQAQAGGRAKALGCGHPARSGPEEGMRPREGSGTFPPSRSAHSLPTAALGSATFAVSAGSALPAAGSGLMQCRACAGGLWQGLSAPLLALSAPLIKWLGPPSC